VEIVFKGKVEVYAIQRGPDSAGKSKSPPKAKKDQHMRKHTPKKSSTAAVTGSAKNFKVAKPVVEPALSDYEKKRLANIAANKEKMAALGLMTPPKFCRNVDSPRKLPRKSSSKPTKEPTKRKLDSSVDDEWEPKKPKHTPGNDACKDFKDGR
jgi:hypothetical protein